jgi:hypothetical protein
MVALAAGASVLPPPLFVFIFPVAAAVAVIAGVRPELMLGIAALLNPTLSLIDSSLHIPFSSIALLILCVIAGYFVRGALEKNASAPRAVASPVVVVGLAVTCSLIVVLCTTDAAFANRTDAVWVLRRLTSEHFFVPTRFLPVYGAGLLLQGIAIFWIAASLTSADRTFVLRFICLGGVAAAVANVLHAMALIAAGSFSGDVIWEVLTTARITLHYRDVNATGSYFAIPLFACFGQARTATRFRNWWVASGIICAVALWLTASRAAIIATAAAACVLLAGAMLARATTRRWRVTTASTLAAGIATAAMLLWVMPEKFVGFPASEALRIRAGMGAAALRAAATHPLFGIGVGEFYNRSPEFMSREMLAIYPRENAHNNYLQILAELGIVGLGAFLWLLYASLAPRRDALKAFWTQGRWNGLHVGLFVFLVTCLSGHPLLVPEVAYIFWIALGLAAADRQEAIGDVGSSRRSKVVAGVLCAFVLLSLPFRVSTARQAKNLQDVVFGVSHWRRDATGVAYRRLAADATFFIPASGTFVDIPLRLSEPSARPVSVSISFDDVFANRVVLEGTDWRRVHLLLPGSTSGKWIRVRLMIEPATAPTVLLGTLDQR